MMHGPFIYAICAGMAVLLVGTSDVSAYTLGDARVRDRVADVASTVLPQSDIGNRFSDHLSYRPAPEMGEGGLFLSPSIELGISSRRAQPANAAQQRLRRALYGIFVRARAALLSAQDELRVRAGDCEPGLFVACHLSQWRSFVADLADKPRLTQLREVNRYVNRARYASDSLNYGVADLWAIPSQLFERGGDCEDYVVAKYAALRVLGVRPGDMRVAVARDTVRSKTHAVLMVTVAGNEYVLDSQEPRVLPVAEVRRYRPLYSLNYMDWWLYASPRYAAEPLAEHHLNMPAGRSLRRPDTRFKR